MKENSRAGGRKKSRQEDEQENYPIFGRKPILEALRVKRPLQEIWIAENSKGNLLHNIAVEAEKAGVPIRNVAKKKLPETMNHQGVVAWAQGFRYFELEELLQGIHKKTPVVLVLDHLEDPHNLGAIIRTAEAVGVDGVIIPARRSVGITPAVSKASAGASELVPIAKVTNIARSITELKEKGFWVVGLDPAGEQNIWQIDLSLPCAVVVGNEGKGISRLVKESCDFLVKLPMQGSIASLNVSVAAAVLLYEILRQQTGQM